MTLRRSRFALLVVGAFVLFASVTAHAAPIRVTAVTDYWFTLEEPSTFEARTYQVPNIGSDPHLWLYRDDNYLIAANDDWFGLQSYLSVNLEPGTYRLRAGVCCGDPDRWWQGVQYDLESNVAVWNPETTTSEPTPTSVTSSTSSQTSSTTTTTPPTTSTTTSSTTTTSTTSTTSTVPSTTSTVTPSSTTVWISLPQSTSSVVGTTSPTTTSSTTTLLPVSSILLLPSTKPANSTTIPDLTTSTVTPSTIPTEAPVSVVEASTTSTLTPIAPLSENALQKRYTKQVGIGPFKLTLTVTGAQRRTVIAAAIVQITTVATLAPAGATTSNANTTRRRR